MKNKILFEAKSSQQNSIEALKNKKIRTFGRIKSRKISDHKKSLLENLSHKYQITQSISSLEQSISSNKNIKKTSFEIGFGFGDFIFFKAKLNQDKFFIGCEPHINGVSSLFSKLNLEPLENIKISTQDAREVLSAFSDNFFDEIYILFPDPWPKIKHFKRRLISAEFLDDLISKKLKEDGNIFIATDHESYKTWILSAILKSKKLHWKAVKPEDWKVFPEDWIETKYQKKAFQEGRISSIFHLQKAR